MDPSVQSPGTMGNHLAQDPIYPGSSGIPLADSMHAMVPYPYIPVASQPQNAEFTNRLARLEQQQCQDGLNSHYRGVQMSQSLQHLQQQLYQMHQAISYDIPALRRQVQTLQAKLERKENDECTRQIELKPRSREQKLQSALKNANLVRIYANTSIHDDATPGSASLRRADQMEALATSLRGRVHRGGEAYLSEAQDAEAWAAKLREDVKHLGGPEVDSKLLIEPKPADPSHVDAANVNVQGEMTQEEPERQWTSTPISTPLTKLSPSSYRRRAACTPVQYSNPVRSTSSSPKDQADPAQSAWVNSSIYPHTPSAQRSKSSRDSVSAVSIKTKESPATKISPVQVKAASELQIRKLAPHLKYAAQLQLSKDWNHANEMPTNDSTTKTQEVAQRARAQVSSVIPPHRRLNNAPTPKSEFGLAPWAVGGQQAEVTVPQPIFDTSKKREASTLQEKIVSGKNARRKKNKKRAPHRRTTSARSKTPELSQIEPVWGPNEIEPWPSEAAKSDVTTVGATEQPEVQVETEKSKRKAKGEVPSEKQTDSMSTMGINTITWQPKYIKELLSLSPSELEDIPPSSEMHAFNRTFITTHLGGMKWLPSFYSVPEPELSLLPGRGYYLLEDSTEPLAPSSPGAHGSLITPILRLPEHDNPATPKPESMQCAPLFIKRGDGYVYYGMYSHLRSDRLDLERCNALIPSYLKDHWAAQLTSPHRPKWVTEALQNHLRPPSSYTRPSSSASSDAITAALDSHHRALESWHRDTSLLTSFLRPANILTAFAAPDTGDATSGLRFWCLGLKCEGWEKGFYDMMCREEKQWEKEGKRDGEKERERRKDMLRILGNRKPVKW